MRCFIALIIMMVLQGCSCKLVSYNAPIECDFNELQSEFDQKATCKCCYHKTKRHPHDYIRSDLKAKAKELYIYAIMSANAYDKKFQFNILEWNRVSRRECRNGFSADIYESINTDVIVIAFRGSDSPVDWWTNLSLGWKGQYATADTLYDEIINDPAYKGKKIITTGHSLGGGLAMHIALRKANVDAYVFDPSPRVFSDGEYNIYKNKIVVVAESKEALASVRKIHTSMKNINYTKLRYNFLSGNMFKQHNMQKFSYCMYRVGTISDEEYLENCK